MTSTSVTLASWNIFQPTATPITTIQAQLGTVTFEVSGKADIFCSSDHKVQVRRLFKASSHVSGSAHVVLTRALDLDGSLSPTHSCLWALGA
jgi:hypothetical protein